MDQKWLQKNGPEIASAEFEHGSSKIGTEMASIEWTRNGSNRMDQKWLQQNQNVNGSSKIGIGMD